MPLMILLFPGGGGLFSPQVPMLDFPLLKGKRMKRGWDLAIGAAILAGALALRMADPGSRTAPA